MLASSQTVAGRAFDGLLPPKPRGELSQSDTSEHTPLAAWWQWSGFPPVDGTSCLASW
jgi:hypothetical protein